MQCCLLWTILPCQVVVWFGILFHNQEVVCFDMFCFHLVVFVLIWCGCQAPTPFPFGVVHSLVGLCALPLALSCCCSLSGSLVAPSVPPLVPLKEVAVCCQHCDHWVSCGLCAPPEVRGVGAAIGC